MDVYKDGISPQTLDVTKVVASLWKFRSDAAKVEILATLLCDFARRKTIMNDIEYYLPQLCHLMIHLEVVWESQALEKFGFAVSQTSLHTALQLSFYLRAAMEDYQPELPNEKPNPAANEVLFYRCARLLQNIERAVVFGSPILQMKDEKFPSVVTSEMLLECINSDKKGRADTVLMHNKANQLEPVTASTQPSTRRGVLLFKRNTRKGLQTKGWKPRFFRIEQQVLFCLRKETDTRPMRAMSLVGCQVKPGPPDSKHPFSFDVSNAAGTMTYQLRAETQTSFLAWTGLLAREAGDFSLSAAPRPQGDYSPGGVDSIDSAPEQMSSTQRKRAYFFRRQINFTDSLTNICESLRFIPKEDRKFFLARDLKELKVPPFCYVPMCRSYETFSYVLQPLSSECHAFTTKARVPALMLFEVEEHPRNVDVMTFLDSELQEYPDNDLLASSDELVASGSNDGVSAESIKLTTGATRINASIDSSLRSPRISTAARTASPASAPAAMASTFTFPELYSDKLDRLQAASSFQHLSNWSIRGLIAKSNDDVRQEVFVMQLIEFYQRAFVEAKLPLWIYTYTILSTSKSTGLIELIPDAFSIDSIKKRSDFPGCLRLYYEQLYGAPDARGVDPPGLKTALTEYVRSMAAYSVVCYLLSIKDRHNGNIMIDTQGHIIHIDFGFVFGLAPGKAFSMEARVPWKLNKEMVEVMGGLESPYYAEYASLCTRALACARAKPCADAAVSLMEILAYKSNFPAFRYNPDAIADFRRRLWSHVPDADLDKQVKRLLHASYNNAGSDLYDDFQLLTNKIAK